MHWEEFLAFALIFAQLNNTERVEIFELEIFASLSVEPEMITQDGWAQWSARCGHHCLYFSTDKHTALRTMLDTNWLQTFKNVCNLVKSAKLLALFGCNIQREIGFKNCNISGLQKPLWAHIFFGKF